MRYLRASHDGAPDALSVPGLPVCPKHLLRGVNILAAGGAGVAGSPLGLVAHVSYHIVVKCVLSSLCVQTQTGDCSRKSTVFILFRSGDEDRITQIEKVQARWGIEEAKENNHNH